MRVTVQPWERVLVYRDGRFEAELEPGRHRVRRLRRRTARVDVRPRILVVPAELRRAAAEVVTARAQGLAALERARAEVAATRALANAARLVEQQPALLHLRTLQAVEAGGATVVLTTDGTRATPVG